MILDDLLASPDRPIFTIDTHAPGPSGELPLTPDFLRHAPSGRKS